MEEQILKLRGLPFSINEAGVASFLHDVQLREIQFVQKSDGQMSGEAFVVVDTAADAAAILTHNGGKIGHRFIEIQMSSREQMDWFMRMSPKPDGTVRLLGLPYDVDKQQLADFFEGLEIVPNGIGLLTDRTCRPTGEAYIQFASIESAKLALTKDRQSIGSRYVEIYPSNLRAATHAIERQMYMNMGVDPNSMKPNDQTWTNPCLTVQSCQTDAQPGYFPATQTKYNDGYPPNPPGQQLLGGRPYTSAILEAAGLALYPYGDAHAQQWPGNPYSQTPCYSYPGLQNDGSVDTQITPSNSQLHIRMRGLPYTATVQDVIEFFTPIQPAKISLRSNKNGKPNGMADVHFASVDDTREAMKRQNARMGTRYIELFSNIRE